MREATRAVPLINNRQSQIYSLTLDIQLNNVYNYVYIYTEYNNNSKNVFCLKLLKSQQLSNQIHEMLPTKTLF